MVILGIDPGLRFSGFAIVEQENNKITLCDHGYLALPPQKSLAERVDLFYQFFTAKIEQWGADSIVLETPFLGKNAQNFLKLGYLRGIIYLLSQQHNLQLFEFTPRQIKLAVTGFGGASKEQVARAVMQLFPRMKKPEKEDVTDALAITLCGAWQSTLAKVLR